MNTPRVYADFHNADPHGRLRLCCAGRIEDLARLLVRLRDGPLLTLYADDAYAPGRLDDLEVRGVVEYSAEEPGWVARIDWNAIRHASESRPGGADAAPALPRREPA